MNLARVGASRCIRPRGHSALRSAASFPNLSAAKPAARLEQLLPDRHSVAVAEKASWRLHMGEPQDEPPSEYDLSLGHITDVLRNDYPRLFEEDPECWNWNIYDDNIKLELKPPIHMPIIRGKTAYRRTLTAVRSLAMRCIRNGRVTRHMQDGQSHGHAIRIKWRVEGDLEWLGVHRPVYISAFSAYSLAEQSQALRAADVSAGNPELAYRIYRHEIELLEIQPPLLSLPSWKERLEKELQACRA